MIDRKQSPKILDAIEFDLQLKPCTRFNLDNGVPVYSIDAGAEELIMIEFVFYAGNWYEEKNIVAATTNFMLKNGTKNKSAFALNDHFEFYGSYLNRHCYNETATFTLHTLSKHLPALLPVMAEILTESVFPEEELAIYKQNQKQRLEVNLKKCDFVANRLIDEYVFGFDHPYGKYTSTLDYDQLQKEELVQFFQQYYIQGKCALFVAGKLPATIQEQLNKVFGGLPLNQNALKEIQFKQFPAETKKYNIINDSKGVQAAIRIARPFPDRHHEDYPKVHVLNNIFGGFFGSRLMSNIREDKGYTYGISSHIQNHIHDTAWLVSTEAGRDVAAATIAETYKEMETLRNELVDEEELNLVRNYMIGGLLGDLDGPFQIISRWKSYVLNGLTEDYFYHSINSIKSVTAEELQVLAKKYLNPEEFYELVVI